MLGMIASSSVLAIGALCEGKPKVTGRNVTASFTLCDTPSLPTLAVLGFQRVKSWERDFDGNRARTVGEVRRL